MPQLHIEEYTRVLAGKEVFIACREGILRDHFQAIIADIKFLKRQGIATALFHNMSNRFANQQHFKELATRLPMTKIVRVPSDKDFYQFVLDYSDAVFKLIFLERKYLIDPEGNKINAVTTRRIRQSLGDFRNAIANTNFRDVLERICQKIEDALVDRVHILPAGKHTIKHELFTVEGAGTLIANNFVEDFRQVQTDEEVAIVWNILEIYKRQGYLKPRTRAYVDSNRHSFYVTAIDGIIVGCVEKKDIDPETVELGALAISTKFRNQRVGVHTVTAFIDLMASQGIYKFISLTNNPLLEKLYNQLGFVQESRSEYNDRQAQSPDVKMFYKHIE